MEIKYLPALPEMQPIAFNFDEIKAEMIENLDKYKNLVVTPDAIQEAKKTRAKLNGFKTKLNDEKIRVKKQILEQFDPFDTQVKELMALVQEPINAIDSQIKNFEEQELSEKQTEIGKIYKDNIGPLETLIPIGKIYSDHWENKGTTLKKVKEEMIEKIEKINSDLRVISGFQSKFETELRTTYLDALNLETVLNKKLKLEEQKKFQEEQALRIAQESLIQKQTIETSQTLEEPENQVIEQPIEMQEPVQEPLHVVEQPQPKLHTREFWVTGTKEQLFALADYMTYSELKYGGIESCKTA